MKALIAALRERGIRATVEQIHAVCGQLNIEASVENIDIFVEQLSVKALPSNASEDMAKLDAFIDRSRQGFVESLVRKDEQSAKDIATELLEIRRTLPDRIRYEFANLVASEALTDDCFRL